MRIEQRERDGVVILALKGQLTIGEGDLELRRSIDGVLGEGKRKILIDLGGVSYMDSSGLAELIRCYTAVTNRRGQLKLLHLTRRILDLLAMTKLIKVFDHFDDEDEALASFQEA